MKVSVLKTILVNCSLYEVNGRKDFNDNTVLANHKRVLFNANDGYKFVDEIYYTNSAGKRENGYIYPDGKLAELYYRSWFDSESGFHIKLESTDPQPKPAPAPTPAPNPTPSPPSALSLSIGALREKARANNCDVYTVNGKSVSDNTYISEYSDELVLKANDGYKFISVTYDDWIVELNFDISSDGKLATSHYKFAKSVNSYEFNVVAVGETPQTTPTPSPQDEPPKPNTPDNNPIDEIFKGVNNLYLLDEPAAKRVMGERFLMMESERIKDKADAIIGLIKLPFDFDSQYLAGEEFVRIADYRSNILGKAIKTDTIVKVVGAIEVPKKNDNLLDYENVEIELFLPFCNSITLDKEKVIGHTIKIEYWINLYNSEFLAIVKNDEYGVIESIKSSFVSSVPFNKLDVTPTNNRFDNVNNGYNGIDEAYLQIRFYKSVLTDGLFSALVDDELQLNDVRGFVEVNHINLKTGATLDEQRNILTLLRQGVIINEN